jgi:hypothetical protein
MSKRSKDLVRVITMALSLTCLCYLVRSTETLYGASGAGRPSRVYSRDASGRSVLAHLYRD